MTLLSAEVQVPPKMNAKSRLELLAERKAEAEQKAAAAKPLLETERALRACASEDLAYEMQRWKTKPLEDSAAWASRMDWKAYSKKWIKERVAPALRRLAKLMEEHSWAYDELAAGVDDDGLQQRRECKQWMRDAVRPLVCVKARASVVNSVGREIGGMLAGDHECWKFYHEFFGELAVAVLSDGKAKARGRSSPPRDEIRSGKFETKEPGSEHFVLTLSSNDRKASVAKCAPDGTVIREEVVGGKERIRLLRHVLQASEKGVDWRTVLRALMEEDGKARTGTDTLRRSGSRIKKALGEFGCYWSQSAAGASWNPGTQTFVRDSLEEGSEEGC